MDEAELAVKAKGAGLPALARAHFRRAARLEARAILALSPACDPVNWRIMITSYLSLKRESGDDNGEA